MAKSNQTDHIGHFAVYRNIESLCCTPGTNIVLQVNYTSVKKITMIKWMWRQGSLPNSFQQHPVPKHNQIKLWEKVALKSHSAIVSVFQIPSTAQMTSDKTEIIKA